MTKKEREQLALKAIEEYNLLFIKDIIAYVPFCRSTFYNDGLDKLDSIKSAIDKNRINTKHALRGKWYKSKSATLQIALYKLVADEEELRRLTNVNVDGTVNTVSMTNDEAQAMKKKLEGLYTGG